MTHPSGLRREALIVAALLITGFMFSFGVVKAYRAAGHQPRFYQENFGPAVMMACGYGFVAPTFTSSPPGLFEFLQLRRASFSCAELGGVVTEPVSWNGTWYYLYGTTALVWRVLGMSWTALDALAAAFGAVMLAACYGLFRLVAQTLVAVAAAVVIMIAPANVAQVVMLRDFSKAPFVLLSVWLLAWLVMRPMSARATVGMAALFGAVVGIGYGFRSDLIVMVPFGIVTLLLFLPGPWRASWRRNAIAATVALLTFVVAGLPPLRGQQTGGCQFHYALLGRTAPLIHNLGLQSPLYGFGDHFLDTFVDLKVGDYGQRMMATPAPNLCAPEYDAVSSQLFVEYATTFPADLMANGYGSVITILRAGLTFVVPDRLMSVLPFGDAIGARVNAAFRLVGTLGPLVAVVAVGVAWASAARLGLAGTLFVLFLAGYPAIQFEGRHWFHLRFLTLWLVLMIWSSRKFSSSKGPKVWRGVAASLGTVLVMTGALTVVRSVQHDRVSELLQAYNAAASEPLSTNPVGHSRLDVIWSPLDYGPPPAHRSSDMLVITVADGCTPNPTVDLRFRYTADVPTHDITSTMTVQRAPAGPTTVFFPVFAQGHLEQTYLRFAAIEVPDGSADCIREVSRITDRTAVPLWMQMQAPADWTVRGYHQMFRAPRLSF
jgi:hypothetical protein